jgi:hypothetical protein
MGESNNSKISSKDNLNIKLQSAIQETQQQIDASARQMAIQNAEYQKQMKNLKTSIWEENYILLV